MSRDKVIDKIRKLMRLSEGTHSEDEAKAALLKAQQLLLENGMSMDEVELTDEKPEKEAVRTDVENHGFTKYKRHFGWIIQVVAENFRCLWYLQPYGVKIDAAGRWRSQGVKPVLVGLKEDTEVAKLAVEFALHVAAEQWTKYRDKLGRQRRAQGGTTTKTTTRRVKRDYYYGFAQGLREAFASQVRERALVLVKDALVKQEYDSLELSQSAYKHRGSTAGNAAARAQGYNDGRHSQRDKYIH